jgi:predicted esterase
MGDRFDGLPRLAEELAQFIEAASKTIRFQQKTPDCRGLSNGANLAARLILLHPISPQALFVSGRWCPYYPISFRI